MVPNVERDLTASSNPNRCQLSARIIRLHLPPKPLHHSKAKSQQTLLVSPPTHPRDFSPLLSRNTLNSLTPPEPPSSSPLETGHLHSMSGLIPTRTRWLGPNRRRHIPKMTGRNKFPSVLSRRRHIRRMMYKPTGALSSTMVAWARDHRQTDLRALSASNLRPRAHDLCLHPNPRATFNLQAKAVETLALTRAIELRLLAAGVLQAALEGLPVDQEDLVDVLILKRMYTVVEEVVLPILVVARLATASRSLPRVTRHHRSEILTTSVSPEFLVLQADLSDSALCLKTRGRPHRNLPPTKEHHMDHPEDLGLLEAQPPPEVLEGRLGPQVHRDRAVLGCLRLKEDPEELVVHHRPNFSDLRASQARHLARLRRHQKRARARLHSKTWVSPRASRIVIVSSCEKIIW